MVKHRLIELESRLKDGLSKEYAFWADRARELAYFQMANAALILPRRDENPGDFADRPKVTSNLTYQVVSTLGRDLYNPGPFRAIRGNDQADKLYQQVVTSNGLDSKMQRSDELSTLHGGYAIQVAPSDDPSKPLKLYPWQATEFYPYPQDDDPTEVWAVLVWSKYAMRRQIRFQLWDDTEVRTYWTKPGDDEDKPNGDGRSYDFDGSMSGPHGMGCLPFTFLHPRPPVSDFWEGALGGPLSRVNSAIDIKLSDLAQSVQDFTNPRMYAKNLSAGQSFSNIPGVASHISSDDLGKEADIFFRQPELQVEQVWMDVDNLIDRTLLELDLPLQAKAEEIRPESGVAIVARRISLMNRTTARQPLWAGFERDLAGKILRSAAGLIKGCEGLRAVADKLDMEVTFPAPALPLPTPDRDNQDKFLLELGLKSRLQLIQERRGGTYLQAVAALKQVVEDLALEKQILGDSEPVATVDDVAPPTPTAQAEDTLAQV